MDLPSVIPIFALPNVVLFPGIPLPLHIFEPRYRDMVKVAAATHEIVGLVLLRGDWESRYYERPDVFEVGCAGRLMNVETLPDGRSNILLQGMCEFEIRRHIFEHPYREAQVSWWSRHHDGVPEIVRAQLIERLRRVLAVEPDSPAFRLLDDDTLSDEKIINFFSYILDLPALEKQGLLEERSLINRARRLTEVLDFSLAESKLSTTPKSPGRAH